jgi:hypothetical protein
LSRTSAFIGCIYAVVAAVVIGTGLLDRWFALSLAVGVVATALAAVTASTAVWQAWVGVNRPRAGYGRRTNATSWRSEMASKRQVEAAKRNVKQAQVAARSKRTIAHLPESVRRDLQTEARKGARRGGRPGHALEDRNRQQLYELAKERNIAGRSKMGKSELIAAIRRA